MKNIKLSRGHIALYGFFFVHFLYLGTSSFFGKYYGEIGITDSQIGLINAMPAFVCVLIQPLWGIYSDNAKYKRNAVILGSAIGGIVFLIANSFTSFIPLLIAMTLASAAIQPATPVATAISLEYVEEKGGSFGFIRLLGTVGYQIAALVVGIVMATSLKGMFALMGIFLIISALISFWMPPVEGHQHGKEKVNYFSVLKDKRMALMLLIIFLAEITVMFNMSFIGKLQSDLGLNNTATGIITVISVLLEIPFLFFGERIYKKMSMWKWLLVALLVNGLRWIAYAHVSSVVGFILIGIPGVTVLACFEFFPALYVDEITGDEMKASAQSILTLTAFGLGKIIGSMVGGVVSEAIGLQTTYNVCGAIMIALFAIFLVPCIRMEKKE